MTNINNEITQQCEVEQTQSKKYTMPLNEMICRVGNEPKPEFIYSGIKKGSIGIVVGPSKSGKTMFCENLGMSIAAGLTEFHGSPLKIDNPKVLILSFEEHYTNRTDRNIKQAQKLEAIYGNSWMSNYIVANDDLPQYISTNEDWSLLERIINMQQPGIVIFDSITRMSKGIEDSSTAQEFMRKVRNLANATGTTILLIHHTHKLFGQPLTVDNIAGSRVVAQELDFMIGINRTMDGKRYLKDLAFRYAANDKETVTVFTIDENCWLKATEEANEWDLLKQPDGRREDRNSNHIISFLAAKAETQTSTSRELETSLVPTQMSRATLFNQLRKLKNENKITESDGQYKLAG